MPRHTKGVVHRTSKMPSWIYNCTKLKLSTASKGQVKVRSVSATIANDPQRFILHLGSPRGQHHTALKFEQSESLWKGLGGCLIAEILIEGVSLDLIYKFLSTHQSHLPAQYFLTGKATLYMTVFMSTLFL